MELITAQTLWKDYDLRGLPLNETVLSIEHKERYTIKYIYFNGEATADGCTRIYAQLYIPSSIPSGASVVLMNDIDDPFNTDYIDLLINGGYTVLAVDYTGKRDNGRYTLYPQSLAYADFFTEHGGFRLPSSAIEARNSAWYTYAIVMARGLVYLESQEGLDKAKISFFGIRHGALAVYKAAFLAPSACSAIAMFNSSKVDGIDTSSPEAMLYNTCLAPGCYASALTVPTYIVEGSNNSEDSLFSTNGLYKVASPACRFYIAENADNALMPYQQKSVMAFLNLATFSSNEMPLEPILEAKNSGRALYYEMKVDRAEEVENTKLHYFYGDNTGAYRNWSRLSLQRVSESEYIAKAEVYQQKKETSAFASVIYSNGLILSGEIITKTPYLMGVDEVEIVRTRLIYDVDMGTDNWMIGKRGLGEIAIEETQSGIKGITSSVNSLTTLKIGALHTHGDRDGALQVLLYSACAQTLKIEVACKTANGYLTYSVDKWIGLEREWTKVTLSAQDLHSETGAMRGWDEAVGITVNGENKFLINSLLWI